MRFPEKIGSRVLVISLLYIYSLVVILGMMSYTVLNYFTDAFVNLGLFSHSLFLIFFSIENSILAAKRARGFFTADKNKRFGFSLPQSGLLFSSRVFLFHKQIRNALAILTAKRVFLFLFPFVSTKLIISCFLFHQNKNIILNIKTKVFLFHKNKPICFDY